MKAASLVLVVVVVAACGKNAKDAPPAPAPASTAPAATGSAAAAPGVKRFECEQNLHACYVPGAHQDEFLHYSDCTPPAGGGSAYGCAEQDDAFCYQAAKLLVCITTQAECDAVVTSQRSGSGGRVAKLAPQSDCTQRHATEF